ncbi:HET-domain-containing protein [Fusarium austroafricanum]|uniref:HET-domain-containing protein n=1 Tax=Fusarium austroafricanum TaxID=2364996 RepID=A0A8H4KTW4_9HYPO|nr:HET-domain-containing protein [Fusarium austroafricanum]
MQESEVHDFPRSPRASKNGCQYCSLVCQAAVLLRSAAERPALSISIYKDLPAELHSLSSRDGYDVVEIYASSNSTNNSFPSLGNEVPLRSDSPSSFKFIEACYERCQQEHGQCRQYTTCLPKRVVDISGPDYKLVEPNPGMQSTYAALSYCWGSLGEQITTSKTIDKLKSCIPRDIFPVVFEEAATVARRLGITYLWIDTVCIIQDNKRDWECEAAKMAEVFENATVTIAASSSADPTIPFFTHRLSSYRDMQLKYDSRDSNRQLSFKARRKIPLGIHIKSYQTAEIDPLDSRAWALQEKELATRFISFTGGEVQWKCKQQRLCECQNTSFPSKRLFHTSSPSDQQYKDWHNIVEKCASRKLRYATDRIPGLAGLAGKFSAITGSTYMVGMWKENLLQDLSWQRGHRTAVEPVAEYLSPSFSWVSITGSSNYALARDEYPGTRIQNCTITDSRCETTGSGISGLVTSGSLVARGPTIYAQLCSTNPKNGQAYTMQIGGVTFNPGTYERGVCEFSVDALLEYCPSKAEDRGKPTLQRISGPHEPKTVNGVVKLLSLYTINHPEYAYENFLILGKSRTQNDAYERIGIGTGKIYRKGDGCSDGVSDQTPPFQWLIASFDNMRPLVDRAMIEDMVIV